MHKERKEVVPINLVYGRTKNEDVSWDIINDLELYSRRIINDVNGDVSGAIIFDIPGVRIDIIRFVDERKPTIKKTKRNSQEKARKILHSLWGDGHKWLEKDIQNIVKIIEE